MTAVRKAWASAPAPARGEVVRKLGLKLREKREGARLCGLFSHSVAFSVAVLNCMYWHISSYHYLVYSPIHAYGHRLGRFDFFGDGQDQD